MNRLCTTLLFAIAVTPVYADELYVAFWNVENLFDTADDLHLEGDEEFLPSAPKIWTRERYDKKCENLAKVIRDMNGGSGPDVLGLSEIENANALLGLLRALAPLNRKYELIHTDSPSGRGIDCALLVDSARATVTSTNFHPVAGVTTRDIVEAQLKVGTKTLYVFANHWPSRSSDSSGSQRAKAADVLRGRVDKILQDDSAAEIVIGGDLNDEPSNDSVRVNLKAITDEAALQSGDLFDTIGTVAAPATGTHFYEGNWEVLDHLIVSRGLLDELGLRWKRDSTAIIKNDYQMFTPAGGGPARPNRTYGGDSYYGGYSDHLPVACKITY